MGDAADVLALTLGRRPSLGLGRLLCIDGPAAAGKTTLADEVSALSGSPVVHLDDLYEGWTGLPTVARHLEALLRPLASGGTGRYRRWDWYADARAEEVVVPPAPLLVLEGVGAGARSVADLVTVLVWVEAPPDVRRTRDLARGDAGVAERWAGWSADEDLVFARDQTRARADLVLGGGAAWLAE